MKSQSPIIDVRNLTLARGETVLMQGLSFAVNRGDIFVILGGSGCGKSTLLRHLIGLDKPHSGEISIKGSSVADVLSGQPIIGVTFQSAALFGSMTVADNVAFGLREWTALPEPAIDAIVRAKLSMVGLEGAEQKMPNELSGGMKKRAAIARALALEPEILFLDEPSAGLDPITSAELDELILVLNETLGITIVMVTHELPSILRVGRTCIMLDKESKGIIATGSPKELANGHSDERVQRFFGRSAA